MWLCAVSLTRVCRFIVSSHGREGRASLKAAVCTAHSNMQNTCLLCCPSHSNPGNSWRGHPLLQMRKLRLKGHEMGRPGCRGWPRSPPPIPPLGSAWTCNSFASSHSPAWPKDPAPWCGADKSGRDTCSCHSPSSPPHLIPDAVGGPVGPWPLFLQGTNLYSQRPKTCLFLLLPTLKTILHEKGRPGYRPALEPMCGLCFFLPLFPTSPDINAPDLSSGLRGRVGKGRGERLINISTARLLGGLIHTLPIFHPSPIFPPQPFPHV